MVALLFLACTAGTYWWMFCARATSAPLSTGSTALGLEDDPDQWQPSAGVWTALDECQLIRLLTDAARIDPSTNHVEHEDTL
ncbi:hypothetical protein EAH80_21115 [Mycobacterium hodleri]|uniref:Secreted protein n=2 Tax=Mycolicibacterium hodleri TaxID=49897 RepID=A0A502E5P1_9MYCO|nr:hypothetical protein EAH80_21115 [Mycolicibacterium hodleri]